MINQDMHGSGDGSPSFQVVYIDIRCCWCFLFVGKDCRFLNVIYCDIHG